MSDIYTNHIALTPKQVEKLQNALLSAFQNIEELRELASYGLEKDLDLITGQSNRRYATFDLLKWCVAQGQEGKLIVVARERVPGNAALRAFAESLELAPSITPPPGSTSKPDKITLEKIVNKSAHFANVDAWLQRMSEVILTVCRIETPTDYGTGFLVGPDLIMTNHHVVEKCLNDQKLLSEIICRFDYRTDARGIAVREGKEYYLDLSRPIISSPFDDLDIALLPVDGRPGEEEVGGQRGAPERKWLKPAMSAFVAGQPLFVVQHPAGRPMQVAFDVVVDATDTRLYYRTNTEGGSSGSPCFDDSWNLVAIHHAASADDSNEGIPFGAIIEHDEFYQALGY